MAEDFLARHETKGTTLSELRELLGEPDSGPYAWMYDLSVNGAPPSGHQPTQVYFERPQLYVYFEGLFVRDVRVILSAELKDNLKFDPDLWKASRPADRLRMVPSLLTGNLLKGRSKYDVRQVLGNPDRERETDEIQYSLGERFIDLVTLSFTRDSDGRISDAQIIEH